MEKLTLGSLFDGSGGFPLAAKLEGIEPVFSSEIEPFPVLVTHKRMPQVKHYGDVSALNGAELPPVDIITFGSPCQDLSIAGKRAGIHDGERSSLFFQAIRIIKEMREATGGEKPRYAVWENVPGAFSSNGGNDFKAVLEAVISIKEEEVQVPPPEKDGWPKADLYLGDGWSVAYRVLDAQYWGVPQRRARIFLVADLNGESAGEILFEPEGMSGTSETCRCTGKGIAGDPQEGAGASGCVRYCLNPQGCSGVHVTEEQTDTLIAQDHGNHPAVLQSAGFCTEHSAQAGNIGYEEEKAPTLRSGTVPAALSIQHNPSDSRLKIEKDGTVQTLTERMGTGGNNVPLVAEPAYGIGREGFLSGEKAAFNFAVNEEISPTLARGGPNAVAVKAYGICSKDSNSMKSDNPHSGFYDADTSRTLDRSGGNPCCNQGGICVVEELKEDTWAATTGAFMTFTRECAQPLMARDYKDPQIVNTGGEEPLYIVRRLMPVECARLQGFPDWWCQKLETPDPDDDEMAFWMEVWKTWNRMRGIKPPTEKQVRKWLADPYSDSAEYKLWGNGVCLPVVRFIMSGIVKTRQT